MTDYPNNCYYCNSDPSLYPYMGLPPHNHKFTTDNKLVLGSTEVMEEKYWPFNYSPDPEGPGFYDCCHLCGAPTVNDDYARLLSNIEPNGDINIPVRDQFIKNPDYKDINFVVRFNLLENKDYSPYCGSDSCNMGNPRTTMKNGQAHCRCKWRSDYDINFINAYKSRWNQYKVDEKVVGISSTDTRLFIILSPVYREEVDGPDMVVIAPQVGMMGLTQDLDSNSSESTSDEIYHVLADSLRYPTYTELRIGKRSVLLDGTYASHVSYSEIKPKVRKRKVKLPKQVEFSNKTTKMLMSKLK